MRNNDVARTGAVTCHLLIAAAPAQVDLAARILPLPVALNEEGEPFVKVLKDKAAVVHVNVVDRTGAPAAEGRSVPIEGGKIVAARAGGDAVSSSCVAIDGKGRNLMPGVVGMHDHQYFIARPNLDALSKSNDPVMLPQMPFTSPIHSRRVGLTNPNGMLADGSPSTKLSSRLRRA